VCSSDLDYPAGDWLRAKAEKLAVYEQREKPMILGRHLLALGAEPGPYFKGVLGELYQAQLAGEFATVAEGESLAAELLRKKKSPRKNTDQ